MWFRRKPKVDPKDVTRGLREQALTVDPSAIGLTPGAARRAVERRRRDNS